MYHASIARGPKDVLVSGGLKIVALFPGGDHGCLLKSCMPSSKEYADSFGCTRDVRNMLREYCACGTILFQRSKGKLVSHVDSPAITLLLNV